MNDFLVNPHPSQVTVFEDSFSEEVWSNTYKNYKDKDINDTFNRVAQAIASVEKTEDLRKEWAEKFYDMMCNFSVVPGGRILANAGTEFRGTSLINCFVGPTPKYDCDSLSGILEVLRSQSITLKSEGGWGKNFSFIRPRGTFIKGIGVETPGAVKFMELFDKSSEIITAGSGKKASNKKAKGKIRKGAMMGILDISHPDIIEFITIKQTSNRLSKFNLSINCSDKFMDKVLLVSKLKKESGSQEQIDEITWDLIFPDTTYEKYKEEWCGDIQDWQEKNYPVIVYQTVKVDWLWNLITQSTYSRNEPGILFLDRANKFNELNYAEKIFASNPCVTLDSWVTTSRGAKQVKELLGIPFTAIVDGICWNSSEKGFFVSGNKPILKISTINGYTLKVTENHKIKILRNNKIDWIAAGKLSIGDQIFINNHSSVDVKISEKNDAIGYALGLLVGDGNISGKNAHLCSWGNTEGVKNVRNKVMQELLQYASPAKTFKGWHEVKGRNEYRIQFKDLHSYAISYGLTSSNKHVNKTIEEDIYISKGFIRGMFDAYGSVQGNRDTGLSIRLSQSNLEDLQAIQRMLVRWGIVSTIYENKRDECLKDMPDGKGGKKEYLCKANHELVLSKSNIEKYLNIIGFYDSDKKEKCERLLTEYVYGLHKETYLAEISSIENFPNEIVADCEIPGINAFDCNGLVISNCGEQLLSNENICCLGSLNLTQFINKNRTGFDLHKLAKYTKYLIRFLDNVNDYSDAPLPEYINSMRNKRRIGAGLMGWGSALFILKVKYGSKESTKLRTEILKTYTLAGVEASLDLADEKGMFNLCEPEKHAFSPYWDNIDLPENLRKRILKNGIRNSSLFSCQPTGNAGVTAQIVSGGIEPVFMSEYIRTVIVSSTPDHIKDVTPNWNQGEWAETNMFKFSQEGDEQILRGVDSNGVVYKIDKNRGLTKEVLCQDYGVRYLTKFGEWNPSADWAATTTSLSVKDHLVELEGFAKYLDSSVSKTINIPNDYLFEDFQNIYLDAYNTGYIKGCTTYRSGSMTSVLSAVDQKNDDIDEEVILEDVKLPDNMSAEMKVLHDHEGDSSRKWYVTISLNENKAPVAIFVQTNAMEKSVTTNDAIEKLFALAKVKGIPEQYIESTFKKCNNDSNSVKIARAIGLLLRHGVRIKYIVAEIDKVDGVTFSSFLFHIKKMLGSFVKDGEKIDGAKCTECNGQLVYESGCQKCLQCGNSKCG